MEAYFHNDPRIEEWVDQITEKLFTVCELTGADSEAEFQRGCQIVTKVTSLLQDIPTFPSEYLEDALKQLLEQQLQGVRGINDFPAFQDIMNRMLHEGMAIAIHNHPDSVVPALAMLNIPDSTVLETDVESNVEVNIEVESEEANAEDEVRKQIEPITKTNLENPNPNENPIKAEVKPYGMLRTSQVPEQAEHLKRVLNHIFPNGLVNWNKNLMGHKFLAQVEDILIFVHDSEYPCLIETFKREGWKVFECRSEDLIFPRRLERGIRQIQRAGKKHIVV